MTQNPVAQNPATEHPVIEKFLQAIETATIPGCDVWSSDATLDATVPGWRLHAAGPQAIRAEYARWFADPGHFDELRRYPVSGGASEVVEDHPQLDREWGAARRAPHAPDYGPGRPYRLRYGVLRGPLAGRPAG